MASVRGIGSCVTRSMWDVTFHSHKLIWTARDVLREDSDDTYAYVNSLPIHQNLLSLRIYRGYECYSVRVRTDLRGAISRPSVWPSPGWYTVHIFSGALVRNAILPGAKFTLHPSRAFFYIGSVTAWHSSSWRQPNFMAWHKEWNYGTFTEGGTLYIQQVGHHAGHRPTF